MGKKKTKPEARQAASITAGRVPRLYRLLKLLGQRPRTRYFLCAQLKQTVRGFYRDLELLRNVGIRIDLRQSTYLLNGPLAGALDLLPFPDPGLTMSEALQLAKGRTLAHSKLKKQIAAITGTRP